MKDDVTKTSLGKGSKGKTDWKKVDALTDEDIRAPSPMTRIRSSRNRHGLRTPTLASEPTEGAHYGPP